MMGRPVFYRIGAIDPPPYLLPPLYPGTFNPNPILTSINFVDSSHLSHALLIPSFIPRLVGMQSLTPLGVPYEHLFLQLTKA